MTCGVVDPPFGNTRLHVIKLIAALISTHNPKVNKQVSELGTIQVMLVSVKHMQHLLYILVDMEKFIFNNIVETIKLYKYC